MGGKRLKSIIAAPANVQTQPSEGMTPKQKPPARTRSKAQAAGTRPAVPNPLQQVQSRWQRTVRYGWDKGGSQGGRK